MKKLGFIIIRKPFSAHTHLRQGKELADVLPSSNIYGAVVCMGNIQPPVSDFQGVRKYRAEIIRQNPQFLPILTLMLTKDTTAETLKRAREEGIRVVKFMPDAATTNALSGITLPDLEKFYPVIGEIKRLNMIFSGHWELAVDPKTGKEIPYSEREEAALPYFDKLVKAFPNMNIIFEHVSTAAAVEFIKATPANVAATITAHHISKTHKDVFGADGKIIDPHYFCYPVLKKEGDRLAVASAYANPKFFFGPDDAPHPKERKMGDKPAGGIFSPAFIALPTVLEVCEELGLVEHFERFVSLRGPTFYDLQPPPEKESRSRYCRQRRQY